MPKPRDGCPKAIPDYRLDAITGPIYRPARAAVYLGIGLSTFYEGVAAGTLPPLIKIGARASGVPKPWLDAYLANQAAKVER
ncbi:MAG: hypothetical protein AAF311_13400 [Pseudomonadota bacterium]